MSKDKVKDALRRYYSSFDNETGVKAYKRGGQMGFKRFDGGGDKDDSDGGELEGAKYKGSWWDSIDFGDVKWGGLAGPATSLLGDTVGGFRDMSDRYTQLNKKVGQFGTGAFDNLQDNNALIMAMSNTPRLSDITNKDIRNKSVLEDAGSALSTGLNAGLATGNLWVGLGAGLLDAGKSIWQRSQAKTYADRVNQYIKDKNIRLDKEAFMAGNAVDNHNDWMRMMAYYNNPFEYALGGEMRTHGSDFNNGFTFINEGGTHESNPNEGVPSGTDDQGNPNLVEQGEVIWNNEYVFSNRIKIPKHLAKKYKLGGDLTFADAITKVTAESRERPNDPVSNETNRAIVNEFMDEQEALREQEQMAAAQNLQQAYDEDFMNQIAMMAPQGQPMMGGVPMEMGMPQQPMMEGAPIEGEPILSAFGGHKFEGGGYRVAKWGNRYYVVPEDAPKLTGKKLGDKYVIDDAFKDFASFISIEEANREVERLRREALPALEYQSDIQASGVVADTGDKISRKQTGYDTKGNPIYQYTVTDPNNGKKYTYSTYEAAALKYTSIPRKVNDPRVKGGIAYVSPYGDIYMNSKSARKALEARLHPQTTTEPSTTKSNTSGTETTAMAATMPSRSTQSEQVIQEVPEVVDSVITPQSVVSQEVVIEPEPKADSTRQRRSSGSSSAQTSDARKLEQSEPYKNYMARVEAMSNEDKQKFIAEFNKGLPEGKKVKSYADWKKKAGDGVDGAVHQAIAKSINSEYVQDPRLIPINNIADGNRKVTYNGNEYSIPGLTTSLAEALSQGYDPKSQHWEYQEVKDKDGKVRRVPRVVDGVLPEGILPQSSYKSDPKMWDKIETIRGADGKVTGYKVAGKTYENSWDAYSAATALKDDKTGKKGGGNGGDGRNWMREVPIWGTTAMALKGMFSRPNYENADAIIDAARQVGSPMNIPVETIGDYMPRRVADIRWPVALSNQNRLAGARGISNTAGGNRAMDLSGNLSLAYNNQLDLGEIQRQAFLAQLESDYKTAGFNRETGLHNMSAINTRNATQAQLNSQRQQAMLSGLASGYGARQAAWLDWRNDRDANIEAALDNWGLRGREKESDLMANSLARELGIPYLWGLWNGYTFQPQKEKEETVTAKGGYKKSKKRRF